MKVINFNQQVFEDFLDSQLSDFLIENQACLIIGIEEGGMPLAEIVTNRFREKGLNVDLFGIKCQRPSTNVKKKSEKRKLLLEKLLKLSPTFVLNLLRNMEHFLLMKSNKITERNVIFSHNVDFTNYCKILIIDDAVDSGYSLQYVINKLKESTSLDIYSLSAVVTNKNTCIWPDFYLHSGVLIRFPWSLDG